MRARVVWTWTEAVVKVQFRLVDDNDDTLARKRKDEVCSAVIWHQLLSIATATFGLLLRSGYLLPARRRCEPVSHKSNFQEPDAPLANILQRTAKQTYHFGH